MVNPKKCPTMQCKKIMQIYGITLDSRDLCSEDRGPDLSCDLVFSSDRDFSWLFYNFCHNLLK